MYRPLALLGVALAAGCSPGHQQGLCQSDTDCTAPTAVCDVPSGVCGACSPAADTCPAGAYCAAATLTCQPGCKGDADCTTPTGDTPPLSCDSSHMCVGCHGDDQLCPADTVCSGERCVPGCTEAHACTDPAVCCDGACLDVSADVDHCGGCAACPPWAGAVVACVEGACRVASCQPDLADCNKVPDDGCEVNLRTSPEHCGACDASCAIADGAAKCVARECGVASCDTGWGDCDDDPANGCETDLTSTVDACGQCGAAACTAPPQVVPACVLAECAYADCAAGYADCDHDLSTDGCEVNIWNGAGNCGACGHACPTLPYATVGCQQGTCVIAECDPGYADCDGFLLNGCERDVLSDASNCSVCGHTCAEANGTAQCVNGQCAVGSCDGLFADCDNDPGNGCETNVVSDAGNCGVCGLTCPAVANGTPVCSGFACVIGGCDDGHADCFGGAANGCETDLTSDADHCDSCGNVCPAVANGTRACTDRSCAIGSCAAGYGDCDGQVSTGCEVDLTTDVDNCDSCGFDCPTPTNGVAGCVGGACVLAACGPGFADCDHFGADGCEQSTTSDPSNCGGCGVLCGSGQCANSVCTNCKKNVLLIADEDPAGATALGTALTNAGFTVTQTTVPSYQYDGTNPPTTGFGAIVVLAGGPSSSQHSFTVDMPTIPSSSTASCSNGVKGGLETDVDCGGSGCPGCALGLACEANRDCQTGNCSAGHCVASPATCSNGVKDGSETDVDCGGGAGCPACAPGKSCNILASTQPDTVDCRSGYCNASHKCGGDGQQAIVDFLNAGNGIVFTEWAAYQVAAGRWTKLAPYVLLQRTKAYSGRATYMVNPAFASSPLWSGLPVAPTGACQTGVDCTRGNACSAATCVSNVCQGVGTYKANCCTRNADCADNEPCTTDTCNTATQLCSNNWTPGCFTFDSASNVGTTRVAAGVTRVAGSPQAVDAVAIRDTGVGRVVHLAHAGNYFGNGWANANIQRLMINAVAWVARCL